MKQATYPTKELHKVNFHQKKTDFSQKKFFFNLKGFSLLCLSLENCGINIFSGFYSQKPLPVPKPQDSPDIGTQDTADPSDAQNTADPSELQDTEDPPLTSVEIETPGW